MQECNTQEVWEDCGQAGRTESRLHLAGTEIKKMEAQDLAMKSKTR